METPVMADRMQYLAPSSIRKMMAIAKRLIAEGKTVYELNIGQPDIPCIAIFPESIALRARAGHLSYSPYIGETFLRETYARYLNGYFDGRHEAHLVIDTHNVLVTVGASHALSSIFLAICNPGDEVIGIEPFFSPYIGFSSISGAVFKAVPTQAEDGFVLPTDEVIESTITPKTRAILCNSPCNPSGRIFTAEEITRLAKLAVKHNLYLVADEVYREMILGDREAFSLLQVKFDDEATMERFKNLLIVVDSGSKSFSLCGARIGFVVSTQPVVEKISLVVAHTVACVSDVLQFGLAVAYDTVMSEPGFFQQLRQTYRERLDAAMEAIQEYLPNVVAPRPDGAFYLMVKFPQEEDVEEFCYFMLEKFNLGGETVAVTPAECFYLTPGRGRNEMRLALVVSPDKMRRSIQIMAEAYRAYCNYRENQPGASL